jgi:hypothetical protein
MKNIIIITIMVLALSSVKAQHLSPSVIGSTGASYSNSTINTEITVGEVVIHTYNNNTILTQGFNQPELKVQTIVIEIKENVKVYPNPTTNFVFIEFTKNCNVDLQLINISGQLIIKESMNNERIKELDLSNLAEGNYLLEITKGDKKSVYQINKSK